MDPVAMAASVPAPDVRGTKWLRAKPHTDHLRDPVLIRSIGRQGVCRLIESVFEVDRADHTEGRVATPVIDPFDPVTDGELGCQSIRPQVSVVDLDFQCGPKRFGRSVVPAHARTARAAPRVYWQPRLAGSPRRASPRPSPLRK